MSSTAKYALRAVVFLATSTDRWVKRTEIAKITRVPAEYLLKVLNALDQQSIIESKRGPGGGYRLSRRPEQITALQVINAVDRIPRIKTCPLGLVDHKALCPLHKMLDRAYQSIEAAFQKTTIDQLIPKRVGRQSCNFPRDQEAGKR